MPSLEQYEHFWDVSSTDWCLLEIKSYVEGKQNFIVFNTQNPDKVPIIHWRYRESVIDKMLCAGARIILLSEKMEEPVREYSRRQGYSELVIYGTFDYLLKCWEAVLERGVSGQWGMLEDYLNDMDGRRILEELIEVSGDSRIESVRDKMWQLDAKIRGFLQPTSVCIWGTENAAKNNWLSDRYWFYFMLPRILAKE